MTREGALVTIDGKPALRFERRYRHPMERVWRAISDPDEMTRWFPSNVEGERAVGAELTFVDEAQRAAAREAGEPTRADGPMFRGTVVTYDPPKVFSFTWGGELLRFELMPDGADTVLVFTQILSHQSVAARNGAGWHMCLAALDDLLTPAVTRDVSVLDETPPAHAGEEVLTHPDWTDVYDNYVERIGPELGVPSGSGAMTWERSTHVEHEQVRAATSDPAEIDAWGGSGHAGDPVRWDIQPTEHGTLYRLTHHGIDRDAELAATWHALLVQLDMYLAAGQLVPVDHKRWIDAYETVVSTGLPRPAT